MSDVDRLRAAADSLERHKYCYDPFDCCIHSVDEEGNAPDSFPPTPKDRATAALLRTVADRDTPGKSEEWKVAQIINAAADLAAIILGDTDERA